MNHSVCLIRSAACVSLALVAVLSFGTFASAQNPFGDGAAPDTGSPFGSDPGAPGMFGAPAPNVPAAQPVQNLAQQPEEESDTIVRILRARQQNTPKEMADAITWMTRIKRFDEVGRLLDSVAQKNWSDAQKATLAREAGSPLWLRLRGQAENLNEQQMALVSQVLSAPSRLARDPAYIDRWINTLASKSAGQRRLAQLRLHDASMAAVSRLIDRLLEGDATVPAQRLAEAVVTFGDEGEDALRAAASVPDSEGASHVLHALAQLEGSTFSVELGAALNRTDLSESAKTKLAEQLAARYSKLPTSESVLRFVQKKFQASVVAYQHSRNRDEELVDFFWRPSVGGKGIEKVESRSENCQLERAAQLAAMLMKQPALSVDDKSECTAVLLQRAYQANPTIAGGAEVEKYLLASIADSSELHKGFLVSVFEKASDWEMHGGAIRALQLVAQSGASEPNHAPIGFLTAQLRDSRSIVRYAALEAIAKIDPSKAFGAEETVLRVALEMTRLSAGPHALVIGLRPDRRQAAKHQIETQFAGVATSVNSARAAVRALQEDQPYEFIVITDRVADQSIFQLLQRLRGARLSHAMPIAILTEELYQHERELIAKTPGVVHSVLSTREGQMQRVLQALMNTLDTSPMTIADRTKFSLVAANFLAKVSGDRDHYAFYPIGDFRNDFAHTDSILSPAKRIQLLTGLGSADSQRSLVEMTTDAGLIDSDRVEAARAFGRSVRSYGMALGRQDVLRNYELYNKLGPTDPVAAKSLGLVLDVLEAQAGTTSWPSEFSE